MLSKYFATSLELPPRIAPQYVKHIRLEKAITAGEIESKTFIRVKPFVFIVSVFYVGLFLSKIAPR